MAANGSDYTFTALLNGTPVDSGTALVSFGDHFGFQNVNFNAIEIALTNNIGGPFYLLDSLQLSNASVSVVPPAPEPSSLTLLGIGGTTLAGYFGWRRRKQAGA
jgi:hypothetical protein